ncbi:hypothetical protein Tsubulata_029789 [Turnera subulata]|uniref:PROP1-like PPR domain-containing protein n=1 Tax=Turnera subulata TaxID=218843 RepID=A0A9Q0F8H6_9ROSI|nr:hypothetical protein Tsubulata_029789 [Turnera subulata]
MNLKRLVNRQTINCLSRFNGRLLSQCPDNFCRDFSSIATLNHHSDCSPSCHGYTMLQDSKCARPASVFRRYVHSSQQTRMSQLSVGLNTSFEDSEEEDGPMDEFLSRFVWIMRGKLTEVYPDYDKQSIDGMLLIIVTKVVEEMEKGGLEQVHSAAVASNSVEFSLDLWTTVWEVSNSVLVDMENERKKEKMKRFLQHEDVAEMCRFAGEIGISGDLLRELRFKWARDKMEETDYRESLDSLREEVKAFEKEEAEGKRPQAVPEGAVMSEEKQKVVSLPKRHGKIKYKIYGLDLSDPKWSVVADKISETGELMWPEDPKPISGKCKLVTEKILSLKEDDDPSPLLAEWAELLQPARVDWISLLNQLKERSSHFHLKVAEQLLTEKSFQANMRDYALIVDAYAKENRIEEAERIITKMTENGFQPDILTTTVLVHMYSKAGNIDGAKEAFERLKSYGFQPDVKVYDSMIMAYVNAHQPRAGESLMREMEARDIKPTEEIYMALLRSFAEFGDVGGASRIATTMQFAGIEPSSESCSLLIEAYGKADNPDQAMSHFDYMLKAGLRPDDRCTANMIAAYEKKNLLDKALELLLRLEKIGYETGPATYTVLLKWFCKLQLFDEAEQLLEKIAEQGETSSLDFQVSRCVLYASSGVEKEALQALGVLETKKEQLKPEDFESIINALISGGFLQDAKRIQGIMESQGFAISNRLQMTFLASGSRALGGRTSFNKLRL